MAERFADVLADYTAAEKLPWSDFFIARGRALAAFGRGERGAALATEMSRLHDEAERAGFIPQLDALDAALTTMGEGT